VSAIRRITMSVYKRGEKGVFYMNFIVNGVRVNKSTGKFIKKEAMLVEALEKKKLMDEATMSPMEKRARLTLSEAIKKVYDERWKNNKDAKGSLRLAEIILGHLGDVPLNTIDDVVVAKLVSKLDKNSNKPGTVNRYLSALKTILRHNKQPSDFFTKRKESKGRIRVLTKDEENQALDIIRGVRLTQRNSFYPDAADLVEVLVDTGMRLSEAINLQYRDISFDSNLISIWINKGDKARSIPMTRRVKAILEARKENNKVKPFKLDKHQAGHAWNLARRYMGLKHDKEFVLHSLRHTCASRLVNKGINLYVVKEWLGHSTIQVTERYAHLAPDKLVHAARVLDEFE
jgi:integrase